MKVKMNKNSAVIRFDNRREAAAILRLFGAVKSADHLDRLEDEAEQKPIQQVEMILDEVQP